MPRVYIAIDMKSFYASVECVARGIDPLKAHLLVADPSRSDQTICLAVSPALKAIGVPGRPRIVFPACRYFAPCDAANSDFPWKIRRHTALCQIDKTF